MGFAFGLPGMGVRCACMRVLGTWVFLQHPRKTHAGCMGRSCACEFLSWTTGPVGGGQISQETEGLFTSPNCVPTPLQVTVVPLLCRDTAKILVPVLIRWWCFRGAQAAMECDLLQRAQHTWLGVVSPSCHAALHDANGPSGVADGLCGS